MLRNIKVLIEVLFYIEMNFFKYIFRELGIYSEYTEYFDWILKNKYFFLG